MRGYPKPRVYVHVWALCVHLCVYVGGSHPISGIQRPHEHVYVYEYEYVRV